MYKCIWKSFFGRVQRCTRNRSRASPANRQCFGQQTKTVMGFLGLLVHLGIFEEVFLVYIMHNLILNYFLFINKYLLVTYTVTNILFLQCYLHMLPVGHTHEDIDSMFSNFSSSLKGDIMTLDGKI